ncbi:MAG: putative DNA binding domain-containing protein [Sphaerochaeta sp.]|jgi:ATP-dependent DNA helicase RecG|nr:putative DNA binding domain-containing protein [Sphaerochaeta sp.]MDX9915378.1 putative DNA binding domain-containing protein [Sphaerochaeta sp.]
MQYEAMESKILEFKERLDDYGRLLETVTAFANTQGGTIIIGIRDSDRTVVGLERDQIVRYSSELPQVIVDSISPQIAVDLYEQHIGGKTCVTLRVFPGPHQPYFIKRHGYPNGVFLRFGSHNRIADTYALEQFTRARNGIRYEEQPCPQVSYEQLSKELLDTIFTRCDPSILIGAGYAVNEASGKTVANVAGTLLFYRDHTQVIPESFIVVSAYADESKQHLIKKEEFTGGIIPMLDQTYAFLTTLLGTHYRQEGLAKQPVEYEIPREAIREALVNSVAHRAYDYEAPTRITLFPDRIEFLNPGTFYAPINVENLKEGLSRYRNPLIADALRKKEYMEKQGIGITLIIASCLQAGLEEPQFVELEHHVKVILYRKHTPLKALEEAYRDLYDVGAMKRHFSASELFSSKELAHYLGKSISTAKKVLFDLQQQGIVEMIGQGPATKYRFIR